MELAGGKSNSNCDRVERNREKERDRALESTKDFQKGISKGA